MFTHWFNGDGGELVAINLYVASHSSLRDL